MMRRLHMTLPFILAMLCCAVLLNAQEPIVQNLQVEDVPEDDGGGLVLSWTPLPQENRIIEYRIYRGITPDSLFYIGEIPVNPNAGIVAEKMFFYDKDYSGFVSINSPGRLKPEEQQPEGSPLYQEIPRDLSATGPMLSHYRILGIIPTKEYYYHTTKVVIPAKEPADSTQVKGEDEVYAGVKVRQIMMYKKLKANHPYYYTVLAVNESRHYFPYAEPVMGIPRDNAPESIGDQFYPAYIQGEESNWMQFEWEYPLQRSDVALFNVYMMNKEDLPAFEEYNKYLAANADFMLQILDYRELVVDEIAGVIEKLDGVSQTTLDKLEKFMADTRTTPGSQMPAAMEAVLAEIAEATPSDESIVRPYLERIKYGATSEYPEAMTEAGENADFAPRLVLAPPVPAPNPASLVYRDMRMLSPLPPNMVKVDINADNKIIDTDWDIDVTIDPAQLDNYVFAFSLYDGGGQETFSNVKYLHADGPDKNILLESELPLMPENFEVMDKPNDKGDYNTLMWGRPVVQLTKSQFLDDQHRKLRVNYDLVTNDNYDVKNVYFDVYGDSDTPFDSVNEFYQDAKFIVNLPEGLDYQKTPLRFVMRFRTDNDEDLGADYMFEQDLVWDNDARSLVPAKLMHRGEAVNDFSYVIFNEAKQDPQFTLVKKTQGNQRNLDDSISYEDVVYKSVSRWDRETNCVLVNTSLDIIRDREYEVDLGTDIYQTEQDKYAKDLEESTAALVDAKATYDEALAAFRVAADKATGETGEAARALVAAEDAYLANPGDDLAEARKIAWLTLQNTGEVEGMMALMEAESDVDRIEGDITEAQRQLENPVMAHSFTINNNNARMRYLTEQRHRQMRTYRYYMVKTDGKARFSMGEVYKDANGNEWLFPVSNWFDTDKIVMLIATFVFGFLVFFMIHKARMGHDLYLRPIAGIQEIDNAIGRATEMGRPILFVPGLSGISDVATLAGLSILGKVAKKAAEYDTRILVPCRDYIVLPIAQSIVREAHYEAGRPDTYDKNSVFFITTDQFAFVAGVNGIMIREKTATNFYMGMFYAESLIMTEAGTVTGAIQISGTDAVTQIPFFITTCDYTLIGEELYAAAAYLAREPKLLGTLKAQDYFKFLILLFIIAGTILSTAHATFLINAFPEK